MKLIVSMTSPLVNEKVVPAVVLTDEALLVDPAEGAMVVDMRVAVLRSTRGEMQLDGEFVTALLPLPLLVSVTADADAVEVIGYSLSRSTERRADRKASRSIFTSSTANNSSTSSFSTFILDDEVLKTDRISTSLPGEVEATG